MKLGGVGDEKNGAGDGDDDDGPGSVTPVCDWTLKDTVSFPMHTVRAGE